MRAVQTHLPHCGILVTVTHTLHAFGLQTRNNNRRYYYLPNTSAATGGRLRARRSAALWLGLKPRFCQTDLNRKLKQQISAPDSISLTSHRKSFTSKEFDVASAIVNSAGQLLIPGDTLPRKM